MYLIAGLGNPGKKYQRNFHNLGFIAVEDAAIASGAKFKKKECLAITAEANIGGNKVIYAKPQTYMNLSGESIKELVSKYKVPLSNVLIIYDDFDLKKGALRIRESGSSGTHNGMRNIVAELSSTEFPRIRIGIKDEEVSIPVMNYVLSDIKKDDYQLFTDVLQKAAAAANMFAGGANIEEVMRLYNTKV